MRGCVGGPSLARAAHEAPDEARRPMTSVLEGRWRGGRASEMEGRGGEGARDQRQYGGRRQPASPHWRSRVACRDLPLSVLVREEGDGAGKVGSGGGGLATVPACLHKHGRMHMRTARMHMLHMDTIHINTRRIHMGSWRSKHHHAQAQHADPLHQGARGHTRSTKEREDMIDDTVT